MKPKPTWLLGPSREEQEEYGLSTETVPVRRAMVRLHNERGVIAAPSATRRPAVDQREDGRFGAQGRDIADVVHPC
jgi:hypothetical protein